MSRLGATIHRRWYIVVPIVLILGALFATDGWLMAKGCGSVDPTDPGNYNSVRIRNVDTEHRLLASLSRSQSAPISSNSSGHSSSPRETERTEHRGAVIAATCTSARLSRWGA